MHGQPPQTRSDHSNDSPEQHQRGVIPQGDRPLIHQVEAVTAIVQALDIPPGGIPPGGLREQVHAACGTGKTIIAAPAAKRIAPKGRVLVLVPTLDLLSQTVRAWRAARPE
ncbi:hypothetical protein GJU35_43865 [Streptomyces lincolnensis]|nr:DEAD/DEAH box helicase family protein [Streptomyces lincolnensis]QMV12091.1 hypothetical protein GJU35_01055 [Streptomyces lincolnensis]QMV12789.1 hypothetical protein GJU35_43865 [Streptomyces lincolnensis]